MKTEITQTGCIYAIFNTITKKYYIGQTNLKNPIIRWKDHYDEAFSKKSNYHLYKSMRKYGIDKFQFQILEDNILIQDLDVKEKEYIILYDSFNNGYNNTDGGQDSSWHSKLTKDQVIEIINLIKSNNLTFVEISKLYNVNPSTISDINNGDTWHFEEYNYPIINKNNKRNFSEEEIQDIYKKLREGLSTKVIGDYYQVSKTTISNINNGKIYIHKDMEYPVYKALNSSKHLETNQIKEILQLLQNTNLNYTQISERLNVGRKTVSNINNGKGYVNILNQLGYNIFPIRKE